jgi:NADP-dependent 3-hydroxy acid dehydrogenase YdfG
MSFAGQRVVIIGASAGVGEATAYAFAAAGAHVIITGRSKERLDAAVQRISRGEVGYGVEAREFDCADDAAVREFFGSSGTIDHLVGRTDLPEPGWVRNRHGA